MSPVCMHVSLFSIMCVFIHIYMLGLAVREGARNAADGACTRTRSWESQNLTHVPTPALTAKKKIAHKARNFAASVFLFIYSFYIGNDECSVVLGKASTSTFQVGVKWEVEKGCGVCRPRLSCVHTTLTSNSITSSPLL